MPKLLNPKIQADEQKCLNLHYGGPFLALWSSLFDIITLSSSSVMKNWLLVKISTELPVGNSVKLSLNILDLP